NGCRLVENPLRRVDCAGGFSYDIDFDDLEAKASQPDNRMLILCNPHNPTGRVWTHDELSRIASICRRHDVIVVSDEIHCELTMPGYAYTPYATVDSSAIVCCSPSKAFNIAGLQIANIVVPDEATYMRVDKAININEVCDVNPFGVAALMAAYNHGGEWLDSLKRYLYDNWCCLRDFFGLRFPELSLCQLQSTYLAWIDISSLGIGADELEHRLLETAHVWVNSGVMYGRDGFIRINFACPRQRLIDGLERIARALSTM
ncbi:MAG: aminotransferase class I/II-fold pyridoxal phosphate-dependent enzyme, partial [Muribaculaceae bacterium]|nr:aminotransferase class I/II-fold pyridoxal phosphate-dependent enzyme [Muribaculaceae bacterium]